LKDMVGLAERHDVRGDAEKGNRRRPKADADSSMIQKNNHGRAAKFRCVHRLSGAESPAAQGP
jgi:hypothetical protein